MQSKKTTVYLLRHGQSEANLAGVFTGQLVGFGLTPLGHTQAELSAVYLKTRNIEKIYASDLARAAQTAQHAAKACGIEAQLDPRLREIYAGQWEGVSFTALAERYPKEYAAWKAGSCCDPVGGERAAQAGRRFFDAVSSLCRENEGKAILIVAHAMVIRCFECLVRYGSTEALCRVPFVHNAALSRYAWAAGGFSLRERDIYGYLGTLATTLPKTV